jgi:hypothetical protein
MGLVEQTKIILGGLEFNKRGYKTSAKPKVHTFFYLNTSLHTCEYTLSLQNVEKKDGTKLGL